MHCASCERTISAALRALPGVQDVHVSLSKGQATAFFADNALKPDVNALNKELAQYGYSLRDATLPACTTPPASIPWVRRAFTGGIAILLAALVWNVFFSRIGSALPSVFAGSSLLALFGLGFVASVSTCLAATGAFLLAYTAEGKTHGKVAWIHTGRLVAFVVGGAVLGGIGGAIPDVGGLYGWVTLLLGIGFFIVGLHLLDLAPSLASWGIRMPASAGAFADRVTKRQGKITPLLVGAATFILPCGFTQTAQALALASGSVSRGALLLGAFALGTLPVLLGVTIFGSVRTGKSRWLKLMAGALLVVFAVSQINGGLTVLGSSFTLDGLFRSSPPPAPTEPTSTNGEQIVRMEVAYGRFSPNRFTVKKGVPVRWEILGTDVGGCAQAIVMPRYRIQRNLIQDKTIVIRFTPQETGTIPFSCQMGMIRGQFTVIE